MDARVENLKASERILTITIPGSVFRAIPPNKHGKQFLVFYIILYAMVNANL